jgi:hypothetical protein
VIASEPLTPLAREFVTGARHVLNEQLGDREPAVVRLIDAVNGMIAF